MKSGLEDRNNPAEAEGRCRRHQRLNEVRPGRPEQSAECVAGPGGGFTVSMKSGLEDRNNTGTGGYVKGRDYMSQ